jgi:ABC-type amino acid transport system permease subunit
MKHILYIILVSALIPATWLLGLTFLGIYFAIPNAEFSFDYFLTISSMLLGIGGYIGLLLLLKGLHKTNHIKKLTLLLCGLIGFLIFMLHVSPRDFIDWLLEYDIESMIGKWPLIVSLIFSVLIIYDLTKNKTASNN